MGSNARYFFHLGIDAFKGGFIGVDVFFVISGYLITKIIYKEIEEGNFSLINFYKRRFNRIIPALLVVVASTYIASYFILTPPPHKVVGQYSISSILSFTNILLLLKGSDYFGLENSSNPLFHTWSLGVEEQFYIAFPFIMLFIFKIKRISTFSSIIFLTIASFVFSTWGSFSFSESNFYLPHSRAWELLTGSIAAFCEKKFGHKSNNNLSLLGIILIAFPIFLFNEKTPSPSAYTLSPVVGTFLLIAYSRGALLHRSLRSKQ